VAWEFFNKFLADRLLPVRTEHQTGNLWLEVRMSMIGSVGQHKEIHKRNYDKNNCFCPPGLVF